MKDIFGKVLHAAGSVIKGKLTSTGVITTIVGAVLTAVLGGHGSNVTVPVADTVNTVADTLRAIRDTSEVVSTANNDPLASIRILIELCKQAWPHVLILLGGLSTLAGIFRKAGAKAAADGVITVK